MRLFLLLCLLTLPSLAFGQEVKPVAIAVDSLQDIKGRAAGMEDSLQAYIATPLDSLQRQITLVKAKLDSLRQLDGGVGRVQDSLYQVLLKAEMLEHKLKAKSGVVVSSFQKVTGLQQQLPEVEIPGISLPQAQLEKLGLPSVDMPDGKLPPIGLPEANLPVGSLPSATEGFEIPDLGQGSLPKIDSSTFSGQNIDKSIEEQLLKQKDIAGLQKQAGVGGDPMKELMQQDAQELVLEQGKGLAGDQMMPVYGMDKAELPEAIDHFANHKQELEKARQELDKYAGRFNKIKSVNELPKNPLKRHPLMGVKWYKRVQPGLQWQFGMADVFRVDIGPRISYLVTDLLEVGVSTQTRASIGKAVPSTVSFGYDRVWGYNLFISHQIKKGFYGQLSYERLNTQKLQMPGQQETERELVWVEGVRLGLGKGYTIYRQLRGYNLIEYNLGTSIHAPYRQQLQVKIGLMWDRRSSK